MKVIIAPHPDDEWIGCGCTMLHALDNKEKIKVLLITREPRTENRIAVSKQLAKQYNYDLKILGEPEKTAYDRKLESFLRKHIAKNDVLYVPDFDIHADHRKITTIAQKLPNKKIQYCVYNDPYNPLTKVKNKLIALMTGNARSGFRNGTYDTVFKYKVNEKNKNIRKFGETPREGDVLRHI